MSKRWPNKQARKRLSRADREAQLELERDRTALVVEGMEVVNDRSLWPDEEAIVSPCPACEILTECSKHDRRNR
jgi:hypothetical protein